MICHPQEDIFHQKNNSVMVARGREHAPHEKQPLSQ